MSSDLDWRINASHRFVSDSWVSCYLRWQRQLICVAWGLQASARLTSNSQVQVTIQLLRILNQIRLRSCVLVSSIDRQNCLCVGSAAVAYHPHSETMDIGISNVLALNTADGNFAHNTSTVSNFVTFGTVRSTDYRCPALCCHNSQWPKLVSYQLS